MTKQQIWNEAKSLLLVEGNDELLEAMRILLEPKNKSTRPADNEAGQTYCRYTGQWWDYSDMVYQNPAKRELREHKGYSKEGISRWTKGGKYLAKLKEDAFALAMSGDTTRAQAIKDEIDQFDRNSYQTLEMFAK